MAKKKVESERTTLEVRTSGEVQGISEEGIVEAYLTKWNTVDAYQSQFMPGSFKKTFEERGSKIKLIWDHQHLIGSVIECREDQIGPWIKAKINLETRDGQDAHAFCMANDVEHFSFGFNTIQGKWVKGVRNISEVRCMECGPSIFPASDDAVILSIRGMKQGDELPEGVHPNDIPPDEEHQFKIEAPEGSGSETRSGDDTLMKKEGKEPPPEDEQRNIDFDTTLKENELKSNGHELTSTLWQTLDDIWWTADRSEAVALIDTAIEAFHGKYVAWALSYVEYFESRGIPHDGAVAKSLFEFTKGNLDETAKSTSLTISELRRLQENKLLPMESRSKLAELPIEIQKAHQEARSELVSALCTELRTGGFSDAEKARFTGLLGFIEKPANEPEGDLDITESIGAMDELRKSLAKVKPPILKDED